MFAAQKAVLYALKNGITNGSLEMTDPTGVVHKFGTQGKESSGTRRAVVHIRNERFWVRVYLSYDVGFSEAYMAGECDSPNLKEVLNLFIDNLRNIGSFSTFFHKTFKALNVIAHFFSHSHSKSIANVAGYDASNELYIAFLSKEMQYSCPIWSEREGGVRGDLEGHRMPGDLEAAQITKIEYILRKARLRAGGRLLEIGSGWGVLLLLYAARLGCTVDTLTLSIEQKELAEKRIEEAGFSGQIRVHFMDYRDMPAYFKGAFDACVSLEMLEAVGLEYMPTYVAKIDWALKDESSVAVLTATTYPERTHTPYQGQNFIRKFHWPHTILPSALSLAKDFCTVLNGRLCIDSIEDFGIHYPRCLREWGRRLEENWNPDLIESLQQRYPELKDPYKLEMFRRKWHYMFVYMEVAYSRVWLSCVCWTLARPVRFKWTTDLRFLIFHL
ncbi:S-adenosyl-L-methionine-dependent methyltransferase [Mycena rosella]|uniref:S-adenosyl-L-methionine-dependent methyltransferase n=1 Tax=Mycena rosella TaxID=1033263 RepID=A0AAD7DEW7_MYCRO|nr:S-adenosyl-L-methionine-dependent methyltransferase [Mycena rosella]